MVSASGKKFVEIVYQDIAQHLEQKEFIDILKTADPARYLPYQRKYLQSRFSNQQKIFWYNNKQHSSQKNILIQLSLVLFLLARETIFGLLIYLSYLKTKLTKNIAIDTDFLIKLYIKDILSIDDYYQTKILHIIKDLQADFHEIISHWIEIDDNKDYLKIGQDNRTTFSSNKTNEEIRKIVTEDIIRFKMIFEKYKLLQ